MWFAILLMAGITDWVPVRWPSDDVKSLELLQGTPVNCLLLERAQWSQPLLDRARKSEIATLAVIRPAANALDEVNTARGLNFNGIVLEGDFEAATADRIRSILADSKLAVVELPSRANLRLDGSSPIIGTYQGVWPGIQVEEGGSTKAAPSGAPWINTNSGFLRFIRATTTADVWLGNTPPPGRAITGDGYLQAVCDAAIIGARWVLAFDEDWGKRLVARDTNVLKDWQRITQQLAWFESNKQWRALKPLSELALIQDAGTGALFSGGILDMIAVKHTPVRAVPNRKLTADAMKESKLAVNVDPSAATPEQKEVLKNFTRGGGTLLSGPAGWKFPSVRPDQITLKEEEVKFLDDVWKEVNTMTGRRNLGARLFNVSSMLSNLVTDGKQTVLHLVNYSGYAVENVTVHVLGKYKSATLLTPGAAPKAISPYEHEDGTGIDIESVNVSAALVLE